MTAAPPGQPPTAAGDTWDRLAGGHFYSSSAWLSFAAAEPGAISGAAVRRVGGEVVAAVPVAELTAPPMPLYRWADLLRSFGLPPLPPTGLLVGPRQGYQTHFLVPDEPPGTPGHAAAVADLVEEVRRLHALAGRTAERACLAMYLTTADALAVRRAGVRAWPVLLGADAWLPTHPDGWLAWLDTLGTNRRTKIRKEARRFREAGYHIRHRALASCYPQLAVAAAATLAKYDHASRPADCLSALRRYAERFGPAARVCVCARGDEPPVGFCIYFVWGDTVFLRWAGFDYPRLAGVAEYFNLLFYGQLDLAGQVGARWIHAGVTSAEAKARRGAQLRPLWLVDLADDSPLADAADLVRQHNLRGYRRFADNSQTAAAITDHDAWRALS